MSTLKLIAHEIPATSKVAAVPLLTLGTGETYKTKEGESRYKGHSHGPAFWLGLAALLDRPNGPEEVLCAIYDRFPSAAPTPQPAAETPAPSVPAPAPTLTVQAPAPAPTPTPTPTLTVQAPTPQAPTPAPVPGVKATHSLDYCPKRLTIKGAIFGLRDGAIYRWTVMYNGQASHWRASRKPGLTPSSFDTPATAPTVKPPAPAPTPKPQPPTVRTVPVAQCETLPDGVIRIFVEGDVRFTVYAPLAGESFCRTILSKIETPAAK